MIVCLRHKAPNPERQRILLVMLPGVGFDARDFTDHGLVAAVHERGLPVDVVAACPGLDPYFDGTVAAAIHREIVEPAQAEGYQRIWFLGISLGGMGALLYARSQPALVEGMVLLAPFLGTQGTIAEVADAGGFGSWSVVDSVATATERQMLLWLRDVLADPPGRPMLYLGYGLDDRFARGHAMLAERLPRNHVVTANGGHDWATWNTLWHSVLDARPFVKHAIGSI